MELTEEEAVRLEKDARLLERLIGRTVTCQMSRWDEDRRTFRSFYEVKEIVGAELEYEPQKMIVLHFRNGDVGRYFNFDQLDSGHFSCKFDDYGSIGEYLKESGFSSF